MSMLSEFVVAFCSSVLLISGLYMLCPSGKLEKSVKYVFALCFLVCVISAIPYFKDIKPQWHTADYTAVSQDMNAAAVQSVFEYALKSAEINFSKIVVLMDKTEDGSIVINKVTVYSAHNAQEIRSILGGNDAEYTVEVVGE